MKENEKNKEKMVRKISIITVFLWIFLIAIMITVVTRTILDKNALIENNDENIISNTSLETITPPTSLGEVIDGLGKPGMGITVNCINGHEKGYFNSSKRNGAYTISDVYYSNEKSLYLCDVIMSGEHYCARYSVLKGVPHYICATPNNETKVVTVYYDENSASWQLLNKLDYPIKFWSKCDEENIEVYGAYNVKHEYYKKDKDSNLILEDTIVEKTVNGIDIGTKVGISDNNETVDIELTQILEHTVNGKKNIYNYFENSGNIVIEYDKLQEITLRYVRDETKETILIKAEKVWEDNNNEFSKRPKNTILQIKDKDKIVEEVLVDEDNNWRYDFVLPKYDDKGNEIVYTIDEKETPKNYEKVIDGYRVINKFVEENNNEHKSDNTTLPDLPNTSDINIYLYIIVFIVSVAIISVFIINKIRK